MEGDATSDLTQYQVDRTPFQSQIRDVELSVSPGGLTRKVLVVELMDARSVADRVQVTIEHQRRSSSHLNWRIAPGTTLAKTTVHEPSRFRLSAAESRVLFEHLCKLYAVNPAEVPQGRSTLVVSSSDDVVVVDPGRGDLVRQLLAADSADLWESIRLAQPDFASRLAAGIRHAERAEAVARFQSMIEQELPEEDWRQLLRANAWMFGGANVAVIEEARLDINNTTDIPFSVEGGFMDVVELKRPNLPFWAKSRDGRRYKYRKKYLIPDFELSGAIAQAQGYILQAEKKVDSLDFRNTHGVKPLKPRGLVVHGRSDDWSDDEWHAFRMLNDGLHGVQVMTFDHLLAQAKRAIEL